MRKAIKNHALDFGLIIALALIALGALTFILYNQKAALPGWVPFLGQDFYELNAEFQTSQAVTPGQGQAVDIAGVAVGKVAGVSLVNGRAVVKMSIETKYVPLIHRNASLLLRPKTGLNDMVIEMDPGTTGKTPPQGATIPLAQTLPNVNPDEFLATLDSDTQQYLALLLQAGATGLGNGKGKQFSAGLRRLEPFTADIAKIGRALAVRRREISRGIHNFRLIADELGSHDADLTRFVHSSNEVLGAFADQQAALQESLRQLPPTLRATQKGLTASDRLSRVLGPATRALIPSAQATKPALVALKNLFEQTRVPIRDQIRPFTRQIRPTLTHLVQAAGPLQRSSTALSHGFTDLNLLLNELAYNPPSSTNEGYLFFLSWLNHDFNSIYLTQDAEGPLRRGLLIYTCNTAFLGEITGAANALLLTELQSSQLPKSTDICP
jgi:phospholipid/cholesterol/gamma-HCH transport system substrate-binding protein